MDIFIGVPAGLVAAMALGTWRSYHRLITLDRYCEAQAAEIEAQLKARSELAPALVAATGDRAGRQRGLVNNLRVASAAALDARRPEAMRRAEAFFDSSFVRVAKIIESNPELRACARIAELRREIAERNVKLAAARASFHASSDRYNRMLGRFPGKTIGAWLKLAARPADWAPAAPRDQPAAN